MNEIAKRLHENRQVELAKEILESNGYEVKLKEENYEGLSGGEFISNLYSECEDIQSVVDAALNLCTNKEELKEYEQVEIFISRALDTPADEIVSAVQAADFDTGKPGYEVLSSGPARHKIPGDYETDANILSWEDDAGNDHPFSYEIYEYEDGTRIVLGTEWDGFTTIFFSGDLLTR